MTTPRTDAAIVSAEYIRREMDYYAHKFVLADYARELERENAALRQALENERMKVAGCSNAASGHWKEGDALHPDFDCAAIHDVARLYKCAEAAERERDALKRYWFSDANPAETEFAEQYAAIDAERKE